MQPQDVGYDEFHGFLSVVSEYTQYMDSAKYPQLILDPKRLATFKSLSEYNGIVEGKKGGDLKVVYPLETPKQMGNVDQDFANWSVDFIKRAADAKKPFYLIHAFAKVHFDNYPGDGYAGRSAAKLPYRDAVVEVDDIVGRLKKTLEETGQADNTLVFFTSDNGPEENSYPDSALHAIPFRQGNDLGRRRPRAWHRLLAGHDQARARSATACSISWTCSIPRSPSQVSRDKIPAERYIDGSQPDEFPARRRWRDLPPGGFFLQPGRLLRNALGRMEGLFQGHPIRSALRQHQHVDLCASRRSPLDIRSLSRSQGAPHPEQW